MTPRVPTFIIALVALAFAAPASAQAPVLSLSKAKAVAAKKAEKVKNDLKSEGARKAKVPGCWRNNERQVSCFFSVYGYDAEQDFKWKCMLRVVVKLDATGKYRVSYGHAVCG
jgi:hypothetical protein